MLPPTKTDQLFDRIGVFKRLDDLLGVREGIPFFLSVALLGLSGVGKSTAVSNYAETRFREKLFDVILWARGESSVSLRQSFTEIAIRLKLPGAQHHTHDENLILVQDWFQSTSKFELGLYLSFILLKKLI
jgi:KaiC/GvpD/RAD55 family RecA-like ATPase